MSAQEQYIVSARKYRPATFKSVVGQRALTATLKNAITGGKLAQAYLFCGPRGVGKTSCARIFAKTINCFNPTPDGEACGNCESCKAIEKGNSFNLIELDAASNNSVDDIRNITDQVNIPAQDGHYRVFIIDEVHMLTNQAFNAFLKTLEEPPKNVVFILATTERHKVIPTILSRCQIYDFRRITINDIIDHLAYVAKEEGVEADREALGVIALKADGAMRDALSIFDQVAASSHGKVTYQNTIDNLNVLDNDYYFRLVDIFRKGEVAEALLMFKEISDKGFDAQFFVNGLAEHIRNLMVSADPRTIPLLQTSEEWARKYQVQAPQLPVEWYYAAIKILNDTDFNYRLSSNKRLLVELALIRLCRLLFGGVQLPVASPSSPQGGQAPLKDSTASSSGSGSPFVSPDGPKPQSAPAQPSGADTQSQQQKAFTNAKTGIEVKSGESKSLQTNRPKSFRLSSGGGTESAFQEKKVRTGIFSPSQFTQAWEDYITGHPEQRILAAAMRSSLPQQETDTIYKVSVDHPAQKQAFESALPDLLEFLKQRLDNDYIKLNVEISENKESDHKMNAKDFLKKTIEENSQLAQFLNSIEAELE